MFNVPETIVASLKHPARWLLVLGLAVAGAWPGWAGSDGLTFGGLVQIAALDGAISLAGPAGLALAPNGTTYIADSGHDRIVAVDPQGSASVLSLTGLSPALAGPAGLAVDAAGNLYVADPGNNRVVRITPSGDGSGVSTGGLTLARPMGVALDAWGNLFIADTGNDRIVEVAADGSVTPLAITVTPGPAGLSAPKGLAVGLDGTLYLADSGNNRVVALEAGSTAGAVLSVPVNGTSALFADPCAVALDRAGNLFIADRGGNRVVGVDTARNGWILDGANWGVSLAGPAALAVDALGAVHLADAGNNRILVATLPLTAEPAAGMGGSSLNRAAVNFGHVALGAAAGVRLNLPVTLPASGAFGAVKLFTQGTENLDFALAGGAPPAAGDSGPATLELRFRPTGYGQRTGALVFYDRATPAQVILTLPLVGCADAPVAAVAPMTLAGNPLNTGGVVTNRPNQVALDGAGNLYVGNTIFDVPYPKVVRIPAGGGSATEVSTAPVALGKSITGVALDGAGNLFLSDLDNHQIVVVTPAGAASTLALDGLSPALGSPMALAFDGAGNLYLGDAGPTPRILRISNLRIGEATSSGVAAVIPTGNYPFPVDTIMGLAVDPSGTLYIAARTAHSSHVVKVAGTGAASLLNLPGLTLNRPHGVATDGFGNLYIVDGKPIPLRPRITRVTPDGAAVEIPVAGGWDLGGLFKGWGLTVDGCGNLYLPDYLSNRILVANIASAKRTYQTTTVGLTSPDSPRAVTVTNLGNQPLVFSADPIYTADFSHDGTDANPVTAATILGPWASAKVSVNFTPQSIGTLSAGITLTNNSLNLPGATQQVALSGQALRVADITATAITLSPDPTRYIQPTTFTVSVANLTDGSASAIPEGTVTFWFTQDGHTYRLAGGSDLPLAGGKATFTTSFESSGTTEVKVEYHGVPGAFAPSSNSVLVSPEKFPVTLQGPAEPPTVPFGRTVALSATVSGPDDYPGTSWDTLAWAILDASAVPVVSGNAWLGGSSSKPSSATAQWTVPGGTLGVGSYTVSFTYCGNLSLLASTAAYPLVIAKAAPTVTVTPAFRQSWARAPLTLTASVSGLGRPFPTGTVTFLDGGTALGVATLAEGSASLTIPALRPGWHSISAVYPGDEGYLAATGAGPAGTLDKLDCFLRLNLSSRTGTESFGVPITFSATGSFAGGPAPTGIVTFRDGATVLGTAPFSGDTARWTTRALLPGRYRVTAFYPGDDCYLSSSDFAWDLEIERIAPVVTLTSSSTSGTEDFGASVTFIAKVAGADGVTPTGSVWFSDGSLWLGKVVLADGTASFTSANLGPGHYVITASYGGDDHYKSGDGPAVAKTIGKLSSSLTITSSSPSGTAWYGDPVTFTVTMGGSAGYTPGGTVQFLAGTTPIGMGVLMGGSASLTLSALPLGSHAITAAYSGDGQFNALASSLWIQTIQKRSTRLTLQRLYQDGPISFGASVTLRATVTGTDSAWAKGTVTFLDGGNLIVGTATLSQGEAYFSTPTLLPGSHTLTAAYSGDDGFQECVSSEWFQSVEKAQCTLTLATPGPAVMGSFGEPLTFRGELASATGTNPTGALTFFDGDRELGTVPLSGGTASLRTADLLPGSHEIWVSYSGDTCHRAAVSQSLPRAIEKLTPPLTVTSSSPEGLGALGQPVTFTATIACGGGPTPLGSVEFLDGSGLLGSAVLSGGMATWTTASLRPGSHAITAYYPGDGKFSALYGAAVTHRIPKATASLTLTGSSATGTETLGTPVTFTVRITGGDGPTPTGRVTFLDGNTVVPAWGLTDGVTSLTTSELSIGSHLITVIYAGDDFFAPLTSSPVLQVVQKHTASVVLARSSAAGPVPLGVPLTYVATVTHRAGSPPTGTVSFLDGTTILGEASLSGGTTMLGGASLSSGTVTFTTAGLALGDHAITAAYAGDGITQTGSSEPLAETIVAPAVVITQPPAPVFVPTGRSGSGRLLLSSLGTLGAPVTFTVTGLPQGATCAFDRDTVVVSGAPVEVGFTITTTARFQKVGRLQNPAGLGGLGAGAFLFGGLLWLPARSRRRLGLTLAAFAIAFMGGLMACGGGSQATPASPTIISGSPDIAGTPAGTYAITLTAQSQGAVLARATLTLTVS